VIKFTSEEQLTDKGFRRQVIKEIIYSEENIERRAQALRRHEIYRDQNKKWVMQAIEKEGFKAETVEQMRNRATNISIARKIVNKLAQTYVGGVERKIGDEPSGDGVNQDQESLDELVDELDFNTKMKKADRFRQLFKNSLVGCYPVLGARETKLALTGDQKKKNCLKVKVLAPWEYDAIEDPNDMEKPAVIIISDFPERRDLLQSDTAAGAQGIRSATDLTQVSDGVDQTIADRPEDKGQVNRQFIWWSDTYHFTTDIKGEIVVGMSPPDGLNPINVLPWVMISDDQDGNFWAQGGDDVIEGSLLINKKMTDINFITFVQGWGQMVIAAENIPKKLIGGPDNAFLFEKTVGGGDVQVFFATSNPPIDAWLETVRTALALLLSTNNLSVRSIATTMDVANAASGVVLMIENSEILSEATDVQETFRDKEPEIWEIVRLWHEKYSKNNWLVECLQEIKPLTTSDVSIKFMQIKPPMSEKEKLEDLKLRKDLGIATLKDLLKKDNPDLTDAELDEKVKELEGDQVKAAALVADHMKKLQDSGVKNGTNQPDNQTPHDQSPPNGNATQPTAKVPPQ